MAGRAIAAVLGLSIVAAILISGRYQIATSDGGIYRLDRLTGTVRLCLPTKPNPFDLNCTVEPDQWRDVPKK